MEHKPGKGEQPDQEKTDIPEKRKIRGRTKVEFPNIWLKRTYYARFRNLSDMNNFIPSAKPIIYRCNTSIPSAILLANKRKIDIDDSFMRAHKPEGMIYEMITNENFRKIIDEIPITIGNIEGINEQIMFKATTKRKSKSTNKKEDDLSNQELHQIPLSLNFEKTSTTQPESGNASCINSTQITSIKKFSEINPVDFNFDLDIEPISDPITPVCAISNEVMMRVPTLHKSMEVTKQFVLEEARTKTQNIEIDDYEEEEDFQDSEEAYEEYDEYYQDSEETYEEEETCHESDEACDEESDQLNVYVNKYYQTGFEEDVLFTQNDDDMNMYNKLNAKSLIVWGIPGNVEYGQIENFFISVIDNFIKSNKYRISSFDERIKKPIKMCAVSRIMLSPFQQKFTLK